MQSFVVQSFESLLGLGEVQNRWTKEGEQFDREAAAQPIRVVMISDTHGDHRRLTVPDGDLLIHAGDYTNYGDQDDARDFNEWLGTLPHPHKVVINGNHENNAPWKKEVKDIIFNAIYLINESVDITIGARTLKIHGTNFFWGFHEGHSNPYYDLIDVNTNIVVTHGPLKHFVDGGFGCPAIRKRCEDMIKAKNVLRLVVSGHIHQGYGTVQQGKTLFANASMCGRARIVQNEPLLTIL